MIITFTIQGGEAELNKIKRAIDMLGTGVVSMSQEIKPNGEDVEDEADKVTAGKRVGRPPKKPKLDLVEDKPEEKPTEELTDQVMLKHVSAFCAQYSKLQPNVITLLREFQAERVSALPMELRAEFLSRLENLPTLT
jgi:hypothetical protein